MDRNNHSNDNKDDLIKKNNYIIKHLSYHQKNRFFRIFSDNFYLLDILKYPDNTKFFISGSSKNVYTVTIFENKKMTCNCPDMKSWAKEYDCVCKHCCFILFRVLDIYKHYENNNQLNFFKDLEFDDDEYNFIESKMLELISKFNPNEINSNKNNIINIELIQKYNKIKDLKIRNGKEKYKVNIGLEVKEDVCPICFLELKNEEIVKCPCCNNIIHKECMEKWLGMGKSNCVYCRSDVWKDYLKNEDEYKNLNSVIVE
jgi:hypothetical protein